MASQGPVYNFNVSGGTVSPPPGGPMSLSAAQKAADAHVRSHRGSTVTVFDATGTLVYTAGPFGPASSQGT